MNTVRLFFIIIFGMILRLSNAQVSFWKPIDESRLRSSTGIRYIKPDKFSLFSFDFEAFKQIQAEGLRSKQSSFVFTMPMPDGRSEDYNLNETPIFEEELRSKYPGFTSYTGKGITTPGTLLKMSVSPFGINIMVTGGDKDPVFIDPYTMHNPTEYIVYYKKDLRKKEARFTCNVQEADDSILELTHDPPSLPLSVGNRFAGDCTLRSYRLALSCTGEYAAFHGGTKEKVLAAYNTTMTRVNGLYERDAAITMKLIANTDKLIYLNANTDPFTNNNGDAMLNENQETINKIIGLAGYDIGHVFSTGGGGIAQLRSPCTANKAMGVTGQTMPIGDPFDIDYVAHEMGHQYGANHTQNNNCQRNRTTAVEPGSASTIMGYAGICDPNVQNNSDSHFHGVSLSEIANFVVSGTGNTCAVKTAIDNSKPIISLQSNSYTIPVSTAFQLKAVASDPNDDILTYCWEQTNNETATMPPKSTNTSGPAFRSLPPSLSPVRYFPDLQSRYATWEVLPAVTRTMDFRCTVRDNSAYGGCTAEASVSVSASALAGPFIVTYPNAPTVSWLVGSMQNVTWNVAKTDAAPVNCSIVDIFLSVDGGVTYPHLLASRVPNTGSYQIETPGLPTTKARIMVISADNIFFDVSNANFKIISNFDITVSPKVIDICDQQAVEVEVTVNKIQNISQPLILEVDKLPNPLNYSFSVNPIDELPAKSYLNISGLSNLNLGWYAIDVIAKSGSERLKTKIEIFVGDINKYDINLTSPANNSSNVNPVNLQFSWAQISGAKDYSIEISTSPGFEPLLYKTTVVPPTLRLNLSSGKIYYWRVKPNNPCVVYDYSSTNSFRTSGAFTGAAVVLVNELLLIDKAGESVIDSDKLKISGDDKKYIVATVTKLPAHGKLFVDNNEILLGNYFTMEDIENGKLTYQHEGDNSQSDDFRFNIVDDKSRWLPDNIFNIKIRQADLGAAAFRQRILLCSGDNNAEIKVEGFGGFPPYTYSINSIEFSNSPVFGNLSSGLYSVIIKDSKGDINTSNQIEIYNPDPLQLEVSINKYDIISQASGGYGALQYSLDNINYSDGNSFKDPGNGSYIVYVRDVNGCKTSQNIEIDIPLLTIDGSITNDIKCAGQKATIICKGTGGLPPFTYSSDGNTYQNSASFSLNAGKYALRIKDSGGKIKATDTIFTANPPSIEIKLVQNRFQVNIIASGGMGDFQYSLDGTNYNTEDTVIFPENGTYKIYVKDQSGCIKTVNININVLTEVLMTTKNITCPKGNDGQITLLPTNGTLPFSYKLNDSDYSATRVWNSLTAGEYRYVVRDNKGDSLAGSLVLTEPEALALDIKIENDDVTIDVTGGTPPYLFSIDGGIVFLDNRIFNDLPDAEYTIDVKDKNGCKISGNALISSSVEAKSNNEFMVFPNPTNGMLVLKSDHKLGSESKVELFSISGFGIDLKNKIEKSEKEWTINMYDIIPGAYYMHFFTAQNKYSVLIIKQ